ncbi:MAG TPA: metallophosphoesterase [Actinomycetes bacterium]|nr:metallophosphoesterase [Actinomycetes bacterium]
MIRVAAVGDLHVGVDSAGRLRPRLVDLAADADLLLLAGDLTHRGRPEEAKVLAGELLGDGVPTVAVLGNHDYHSDQQDAVTELLQEAGVIVLEGDGVVVRVGDRRVGIAGTKGFGGGFAGASASDFGEPEMKAFVAHTRKLAGRLERALTGLRADRRIALLHYSPVAETLSGEPREIYPFLGSYLLAEAVDHAGADLVLHGHAHRGSPSGVTPGGVPVRNVAAPVIGCAYQVFHFDADGASA